MASCGTYDREYASQNPTTDVKVYALVKVSGVTYAICSGRYDSLLEMWKYSNVSAQTWSHLDSSNDQQLYCNAAESVTGEIANISTQLVGSVIHMAVAVAESLSGYQPEEAIYYLTFNTATDQWSGIKEQVNQVGSSSTAGSRIYVSGIAVRSGGDVFLYWYESWNGLYGYEKRTGTDTWSGQTSITTNATGATLILGDSDRVHFFYGKSTGGGGFYNTLNSSDSWGTERTFTTSEYVPYWVFRQEWPNDGYTTIEGFGNTASNAFRVSLPSNSDDPTATYDSSIGIYTDSNIQHIEPSPDGAGWFITTFLNDTLPPTNYGNYFYTFFGKNTASATLICNSYGTTVVVLYNTIGWRFSIEELNDEYIFVQYPYFNSYAPVDVIHEWDIGQYKLTCRMQEWTRTRSNIPSTVDGDLFSELSDTALTSHDTDKGGTWSDATGADDTLVIEGSAGRVRID